MTVEEKKLILGNYGIYITRVETARKKVEELKKRSVALTANISELPQGQADGSKVERAIESIEHAIAELIAEECAACDTIDRIINSISKLSDPRERQILTLKYVGEKDGTGYKYYRLWEIARKMGYSTDRIEQLHRAALRKLQL